VQLVARLHQSEKNLSAGNRRSHSIWSAHESDSGLGVVSGSVYPIASSAAFGPAENAIIIKSGRHTGCCYCYYYYYASLEDTPPVVAIPVPVSDDSFIIITIETIGNYNTVISIDTDTTLSLFIHNNNNNNNNNKFSESIGVDYDDA
jgi:hypothetical protein